MASIVLAMEYRGETRGLQEVLLRGPLRRQVVLLAAFAVSLATIYEAARLYIAWRMGRSSDLAVQIRGAKLEGNAEAWDRLGDAFAANFDNADPGRAEQFYKQAVKLDPRSARYWMDLASVYEQTGDISSAKFAYQQARAEYPISADVAWRFGNFLMRDGDESEGLEQIRRAVSTDPKLSQLAIGLVWSFEPNVSLLLRTLPPARGFYVEALNYLAAGRQDDAALQLWGKIVTFPAASPPNLSVAFPLIDELIASDRAADAQRVWKEALAMARWPTPKPVTDSAIWNGGFEEPVADGGLDWRFEQNPGDYISVDPAVRHSGTRSLRVDFTGGMNLDFAGVWQFVPVEPATTYDFRCFMRTRAISTESGMMFEILDSNNHEVNLHTSGMTGTNAWTAVNAQFVTGADTHFLQIRLRRFPGRLFDNKLSGTVWIDDATLIKSGAAHSTL